MHLSKLLGSPLVSPGGEALAKVDDVIVRLRGQEYPVVTGLVAAVARRRLFVPVQRVAELAESRVALNAPRVDPRPFERREGEVLLRQDILGHRLIDVAHTELVRAWDVEIQTSDEGWVLSCFDTRRPARLFGLLRAGRGHPCEDWKSFEPLIGHRASVTVRGPFRRLRRFKPAQLADILEGASRDEKTEILEAVHADPELEADVFEELDPDTATRFFADKTDAEVAEVLSRMRPDDAVDAIADLPQPRRQKVLGLLPLGTRTKLLTLLGFNSTSAGGMMNVEFVTCPEDANAGEALRRVHLSATVEPQAQTSVFSVSAAGRLVGVVTVIDLLHADPEAALADLIDPDPVRVGADSELVDVALLMADYNLLTVPVVDGQDRLLGVVTVDDVLEATIPDDWRRREPPPRPAAGSAKPGPEPQDQTDTPG